MQLNQTMQSLLETANMLDALQRERGAIFTEIGIKIAEIVNEHIRLALAAQNLQ